MYKICETATGSWVGVVEIQDGYERSKPLSKGMAMNWVADNAFAWNKNKIFEKDIEIVPFSKAADPVLQFVSPHHQSESKFMTDEEVRILAGIRNGELKVINKPQSEKTQEWRKSELRRIIDSFCSKFYYRCKQLIFSTDSVIVQLNKTGTHSEPEVVFYKKDTPNRTVFKYCTDSEREFFECLMPLVQKILEYQE